MVKQVLKSKLKKSRKTRFGYDQYQKDVNSLTGALGPTDSAYWAKVGSMVGDTTALKNQPLMVNMSNDKYYTAYDQEASWEPWSLNSKVASFGSKKKRSKKIKRLRKSKKSKKSKKSRKSRKPKV